MILQQVSHYLINLILNMGCNKEQETGSRDLPVKGGRSFTFIVAFLAVALVGIALMPLLPLKLSSSHALSRLNINYSMPRSSSRVIETEVTSLLEAMFARIKGIKNINSTSANGWGSITLELDKHADIDATRFEVSTIIRQTWPNLPDGLTYPMLAMSRPDDKESRAFLSYTINAATTPILIQRYAENWIRPRLASIPGVYRVDITGGTPMEWRLEYDSRQLSSLGISVDDIKSAINQYYKEEFLGIANMSKSGNEWIRLALMPDAQSDGFDPTAISVTGKEGKLIRLDQLLKVSRQEEVPSSYYRINGLNSVYISIHADETANQLQLANQIKKEMDAICHSLPNHYEIHTSYDATEFIQSELNKISIRSGLSVLILLLFILLITRNVKYMFLIVVSLVVNLLIAVIFYYLFGLEMQIYSLAGITISLSLVIDNTIVMTDHIRTRHNKEAFLPILAATVTTMGALSIIFFLDEKIRLDLQDFAAVVIINLTVSLFVALFFVPAMIEKMGMFRQSRNWQSVISSRQSVLNIGQQQTAFHRLLTACYRLLKRFPVFFNRCYLRQINFFIRWRVLACIVIVLAFGLPLFMLPDKIEMKSNDVYSHRDSMFIETYNKITSGETYKEKVKPVLDKALGGSLRLFVQKVFEGSYFTQREETVLTVTASMPNGTTLEQMNNIIRRMEAYLSHYKEIKQFQTYIINARQARIDILFTHESELNGFPYTLKSYIISKALELGGGSWGVYGLQDQGFSNDVHQSAGNFRFEMYGYNYDELYSWAEKLKEKLLSDRRIKEVLINSEFSWWKDDYQEFSFNLNKARMAQENILPTDLFNSIKPVSDKDVKIGTVTVNNELENLKLFSSQSNEYDIWHVNYMPQQLNGVFNKLSEIATIGKGQAPQKIAKVNQQYRLCLQYEYIGASSQGQKILERTLNKYNTLLPMGYSSKIKNYDWGWDKKDNHQYLLLFLIISIIYFACSILFNSLKQPLAIIFVIPVSYIGVFSTFYWFKLNFDQGGFASFVLLCGITVNASIYIISEYNKIRKHRPLMHPYKAYIKAWNAKITPIFLTIVSTILSFIPFMVGTEKEAFWFPLAAGTIGGLIMSVLGIFLFLPIFALSAQKKI